MTGSATILGGDTTYIQSGTTYAKSNFQMTTAGTITVQTTSIAFTQITGSGGATITLTGDVTGSGSGTISSTIAGNAVTNAKLAQMSAHTYKGNNTGSTANAADITSTQLTADLNLFTSSLQGLTPSSGGGATNFLRADGTWAAPSGSGSVTSVAASGSQGVTISGSPITSSGTLAIGLGNVTPSSVAATGTVTGSNLSGTNTGDQTITLTGDVTGSGTGSFATTIAGNAVTNAKLAQMGAHTYKGNNTGSTANAADITSTQLTADLNLFSSSLQGLAPGSGGGSTNFLRADGTWAAPGGGTGTVVYAVISGCLPSSITGTKTTAQMSVSSGQAADSTNAAYIASAGYTWKASNGNAINGTDAASSTLANSTTYHMFLCTGGSGTGTFASASLTPTFPTGYSTYHRRIFSFLTDTSGNPIPYTAIGM